MGRRNADTSNAMPWSPSISGNYPHDRHCTYRISRSSRSTSCGPATEIRVADPRTWNEERDDIINSKNQCRGRARGGKENLGIHHKTFLLNTNTQRGRPNPYTSTSKSSSLPNTSTQRPSPPSHKVQLLQDRPPRLQQQREPRPYTCGSFKSS